jgi:hypothetical protein
VILIDRAGNIAFRTDTAAGDRNIAAVFNRMASNPNTMTEEKANGLIERALTQEIESVLNRKD